jgi:hypothetical protein
MWKYDESSVIKIADIGCDSYKSIVNVNGIPYWFNRQGIYRWGGSLPQLVSGKVQLFIDAIDQTKLDEVLAVNHDFEYRVFIGDVTVEETSYVNCWLCFDARKEKWYVRCTSHIPKSASTWIIMGRKRAFWGTSLGYVMGFGVKSDQIYSDDGEEIDSFFVTSNYAFGDPSVNKFNTNVIMFSRNSQGLKVAVDADNRNEFQLANVQFDKKYNASFNILTNVNRYRFKIFEKSSNKSWEFEGMIIESMDIIEEI